MSSAIAWMKRRQMLLCLAAIAATKVIGCAASAAGEPLGRVINPALGLLLSETFLGVPFAEIGQPCGISGSSKLWSLPPRPSSRCSE